MSVRPSATEARISFNKSRNDGLTVDLISVSIARKSGTPEPSRSASWLYIRPRSRDFTRRLRGFATCPATTPFPFTDTGKSFRSSIKRNAADSVSASSEPVTFCPASVIAMYWNCGMGEE